jgi:hypothetical protein
VSHVEAKAGRNGAAFRVCLKGASRDRAEVVRFRWNVVVHLSIPVAFPPELVAVPSEV